MKDMNLLLLVIVILLQSCSRGKNKPDIVSDIPQEIPTAPKSLHIMPFQIIDHDSGSAVSQLKSDTKLVNIELFSATKQENDELHRRGITVICYYSLSYEAWRSDAASFPKEAIGKKMDDWDEKWTDLRRESLHVFMDRRDVMAKGLGCDGVENDNMDDGDEAFDLRPSDLIASNARRARHAHSLGLFHIAKNTPGVASQLSQQSDGVFIEECGKYDECNDYSPWKGKFVGMIEYSKKNANCLPWAVVQYHDKGYFDASYTSCK